MTGQDRTGQDRTGQFTNNVYFEDCMTTMKRIPDDFVDHCITSPPYNFNLRVHSGKHQKRSVNEKKKYTEYADALSMDEYFNWQKDVITEMLRITKGIIFYNIQMITGNKTAIMKLIGHFAEQIKEVMIWDKIHSEPAIGEGILNSEYEFIIVFDKYNAITRKFTPANFQRGTLKNVFRIKKNSGNGSADIHNATFPRALAYKLIKYFTNEGELIYDPFVGTGTTPCCCIELKRDYLASEITKQYYQLTLKNIKNIKSQQKLF